MTPQLFCRAGEALYGAAWMAPLSGAIDVAPRTISRWASGKSRLPPNIARELQELVRQRGELLAQVGNELSAALAEADQPPHGPDTPPAT